MSSKKYKLFLLIFSLTVTFCFPQSLPAQSGRRPPKPPLVLQPVQLPLVKEDGTNKQTEKIEYLLLVGEVQNEDSYLDTLMLTSALDSCLRILKNQPKLKLKAESGGKMNFRQAQDLAKDGKNIYILWIGFALENLGRGKTQVNHADFTILKPDTAEKLFTGRIDSEKLSKNGGVMQTKKSISEAANIGNISEEIIYRLLRWGWLK